MAYTIRHATENGISHIPFLTISLYKGRILVEIQAYLPNNILMYHDYTLIYQVSRTAHFPSTYLLQILNRYTENTY
jgi:hypothetical protein